MMKRTISLLLTLLLTLTLCAPALAAGPADLTAGGSITLTGDVTLTDDVTITKDTVLDLNGHTITGRTFTVQLVNGDGRTIDQASSLKLIVANGASVTLKNGTLRDMELENNGTMPAVTNVTMQAGNAGRAINNNGTIRLINYCVIRCGNSGIFNFGDIERIDNCDIETGGYTAVASNMFVSEYDADGKNTIASITRCRIVCTNARQGSGFAGGEPCNGATVIENSVLIGYGRGGMHVYGQNPVTVKNSVIIGTAAEYGVSNPVAVWTAMTETYSTYAAPKLIGCTLIAKDGPCGHCSYDDTTKTYPYVEVSDMTNCSFIRLSGSNWQSYATWTMDPMPAPAVKPAGLNNFTAVNTYVPGQFKDVSSSFWGAANIAKAYELGLMKGDSATKFNPTGKVTLAQAITMAARLHSIYNTGTESFTQGAVWYQTYVDYAAANGIPANYADYDAPATRAQFASILAAAFPADALAAINNVADGAIPDVAMSEAYAGAVYMLYRAGILTGNDAQGTFTPGSTITRAEAAAIVTRMADDSLRKSITL